MISHMLLSDFTGGYIAGIVMAHAEHSLWSGWNRFAWTLVRILAAWAVVLTVGMIFRGFGL